MNNTGDRIARKVTDSMATWSFIIIFLSFCLAEIALNAYGVMHFDPNTIILNLALSLMAAIQGSIIMIAQKQADEKRDEMLEKILSMEEAIQQHLVGDTPNQSSDQTK